MKKIVVLISGSGSNLQSILDACHQGQINGHVVAVFSNKAEAYGLERARQAGVDAHTLVTTHFPDRNSFDQQLITEIDRYTPDLVVLAGYMRILTPGFVAHYAGRMLNIHPSLLPRYPGLHTHRQAIANKDSLHGASVHFVTDELDGGPLVIQASVPIYASDDEASLATRVLHQEHIIYPRAINWFTEGRLVMSGDIALLDGKPLFIQNK